MNASYKTLANSTEGIFKDRGSKFLAFGFQVSNEDEARAKLEDIRKEYHDARHHCYAWRLGNETIQERANDDGEPGNSAGKPILNQLIKYELTNVILVVVRYFGGTLLGVGGLINAYRSATEDALKKARIIKVERKVTYRIVFEYANMNSVMSIVKDHNLDIYTRDFGNTCQMEIGISMKSVDEILKRFNSTPEVSLEKLA